MSVKLKVPVAEPKAEESEGEEVTESVDEAAKLKQENEDLKAKLAEAETRQQRQPTPQAKVTATYLRGMTEKQREFVEQQTGMAFDDVVKNVESQEANDARSQTLAVQARSAVRDAIDEEVDRNPQVSKLKGHIRDYFSDISDAEKADPAAMQRHMKRALIYAKGAAGVPETKPTGRTEPRTPGPGEGGGNEIEDNDPKAGAIKEGTYRLNDGFKLEIKDLIPEEKRKKMVHPEHPTGIRIASDFDQEPRFR